LGRAVAFIKAANAGGILVHEEYGAAAKRNEERICRASELYRVKFSVLHFSL